MATIIKTAARTESATRFMDVYGLASNTSNFLYLATGRPGTATGATPPQTWADPANPDTPIDNIDDEVAFWLTIIGMKRIDSGRTMLVVPRYNWTNNTVYIQFDNNSITAYNDQFYVMNTEYRVYKCTTAGGGNSTSEPLKISEVAGIITGGDGYVWEYLYELSQPTIDTLLNDNWLPVNYADTIDGADTTATRDDAAAYTLGARYVLIQVILRDTDTDLGLSGTVYRQTAIISNPLDADGTLKLTATSSNSGDIGAAGFTIETGNMLHLENKGVITRASDQTEIVQTILQF